jgi:hypothetical protein
MFTIYLFLTNVNSKQFGAMTLFSNFKEIILHLVHLLVEHDDKQGPVEVLKGDKLH